MFKMTSRLVIFAGAPEAAALKWDEDELLTGFIEPVARFADLEREDIPITPDATKDLLQPPAWRSLPLERKPLTTGFTQSFDDKQYTKAPQAQGWLEDTTGASFFAASEIDSSRASSQSLAGQSFESIKSAEEILSQFYEESYARHEDIPSSQIAPVSDASTSFASTEFSGDSFDSLPHPGTVIKDVPIAGHLSNLNSIPNAQYLNSIQPQTMTVNLIIGIISLPAPRAIKTRRGVNVELIEVLAGDETKSGFGINFWLSPGANPMRSILESLRPRDVILVKNVALSSFRDKVYGQSLRKDMTKVYLLYRNRLDKTDGRGCYNAADLVSGVHSSPQIEKTRRVREWVFKFVGLGVDSGGHSKGKGKVAKFVSEVLPDDTQ
jgi:hypothetical protein